jgi:hypothetical protein
LANLAIPAPPLEVRGFDALEARVTRAYEMFVAAGEHRFEVCGDAHLLLPRVIGLRWSMVSTHSGETVGGGLDILAVDDDRIRADHQHRVMRDEAVPLHTGRITVLRLTGLGPGVTEDGRLSAAARRSPSGSA